MKIIWIKTVLVIAFQFIIFGIAYPQSFSNPSNSKSVVSSPQKISITTNAPLKIGDKVPDISLGEILNHPVLKKAKISDFKGKLLILDFWSVYCGSCIDAFPKMQKLQNEFRENVVILPVGFDGLKAGSVKEYLERTKGSHNELKLPTTVQGQDERMLENTFPFEELPHEVWIDPNGILIGITGGFEVSARNIDSALHGARFYTLRKRKYNYLDDSEQFLIPKQAEGKYAFYGSLFTNYIDTLNINSIFTKQHSSDSSVYFCRAINKNVYEFYIDTYRYLYNFMNRLYPDRRIIAEPQGKPFYNRLNEVDSKNWDNVSMKDYFVNNTFCYEMVLPKEYTKEKVYQFMINDFDRYFKIKSHVEKRKVRCLAIVKTKNDGKYRSVSKIKNTFIDYPSIDNPMYVFQQGTAEELTMAITSSLKTSLIVLDELNISGPIDIAIPAHSTISECKEALKKYDLDLIEVDRNLDMLILTNTR